MDDSESRQSRFTRKRLEEAEKTRWTGLGKKPSHAKKMEAIVKGKCERASISMVGTECLGQVKINNVVYRIGREALARASALRHLSIFPILPLQLLHPASVQQHLAQLEYQRLFPRWLHNPTT